MKQYVARKGMKSAVQQFVQACMICQKAKPDRAKTPGLLQPLPVPDSAWKIITMDFVGWFASVWICQLHNGCC
jgi:hypothetical protein